DQYKEDPGKKENIKKLPLKEQMEETMFLGLRMEKGVSRIRFYERFAVDLKEIYENSLNKLEQGGFIKWRGDFLVLTKRGVDVSNQVLAQFLFD
ncbi:coproporphyrinogen III oxidase, partial [bacterium 1XD42-8]